MELDALFLGREPIFDIHGELFGFELLFIGVDAAMTLSRKQAYVVAAAMNLQNLEQLTQNKVALVSVDKKFLDHEMVLSVPTERFIFQIDAIVLEQESTLIAARVKQGFRFCIKIEDITQSWLERLAPFASLVMMLNIGFDASQEIELEAFIKTCKTQSWTVLLSQCPNDQTMLPTYIDYGVTHFQKATHAPMAPVYSKLLSPEIDDLMTLVNLLTCRASHSEISRAFTKTPNMTLLLLQYLNSSHYSFKTPIDSIDRMITLLGHDRLRRWLFLTLYAASSGLSGYNPILVKVQYRTELLVELYVTINPSCSDNMMAGVYFMGMLSLIDSVINRSKAEILERLTIEHTLREAILEHKGFLGEMLALVEAIEKFDLSVIQNFIEKYNISPKSLESHLRRTIERSDSLTY